MEVSSASIGYCARNVMHVIVAFFLYGGATLFAAQGTKVDFDLTFTLADHNGDGNVDVEEFATWVELHGLAVHANTPNERAPAKKQDPGRSLAASTPTTPLSPSPANNDTAPAPASEDVCEDKLIPWGKPAFFVNAGVALGCVLVAAIAAGLTMVRVHTTWKLYPGDLLGAFKTE